MNVSEYIYIDEANPDFDPDDYDILDMYEDEPEYPEHYHVGFTGNLYTDWVGYFDDLDELEYLINDDYMIQQFGMMDYIICEKDCEEEDYFALQGVNIYDILRPFWQEQMKEKGVI